MASFFVCTLNGEHDYSHREFETRELAEAAASADSWIVAVDEGQIVDARFDTPGVAIRAVKRALKWRQPVPAPVKNGGRDG